MIIRINIDGACNNHLEDPPMGIGAAVFFNDEYQEEYSVAQGFAPGEVGLRGTNNIAEWLGCILGMQVYDILKDEYPDATLFVIQSDSSTITNQYNGRFKINSDHFREYYQQAHQHAKDDIKIEWVPREQNKEADKLSKEGLRIAAEKV